MTYVLYTHSEAYCVVDSSGLKNVIESSFAANLRSAVEILASISH